MTLRASPQSLARRVAQLEANARASVPLLVYVRCFSGPCIGIKGPDGVKWNRNPDEVPEAFTQRVEFDAREAMRRCVSPPALWVLHECHTATD